MFVKMLPFTNSKNCVSIFPIMTNWKQLLLVSFRNCLDFGVSNSYVINNFQFIAKQILFILTVCIFFFFTVCIFSGGCTTNKGGASAPYAFYIKKNNFCLLFIMNFGEIGHPYKISNVELKMSFFFNV